nr:AMP-binding protein [uncultured Sphingomonas sp.]
MNRAQHLFRQAESRPTHKALIAGDRRLTYLELAKLVTSMAERLAARGVEQGDRVGAMIPNSLDFIIVQQALFALGAVFTPINIYFRHDELEHLIRSCGLNLLILPEELADRVHPLRTHQPETLRDILVLEDHLLAFAAINSSAAPLALADVKPEDAVLILNTSATTGKSKGVPLTAANLAANYDRTPQWLGLNGNDVVLCALPLYNTFGLNQCINAAIVTGATLVLESRFDAHRVAETIYREQCTFLPAVPTMLQKLLDGPSNKAYQLRSLRLVMTGGAPVPAALLRRLNEFTSGRTRVVTGYGLTEGTALVTLTDVELDETGEVRRGGSIGRVLDGMELAILDPEGIELPAGNVGEICIRGPNIMSGYLDSPEDSAIALAGGWLHSGDLGVMDEDGFVTIVDRIKDIIIRGGQNIYPGEIEEVLYDCGGVAEVAVVGRSHDMLGEVPVAYVAPAAGLHLNPCALIEACKQRLAPYKTPVEIRILPSLPKGPTGKILRRKVRAEHERAA